MARSQLPILLLSTLASKILAKPIVNAQEPRAPRAFTAAGPAPTGTFPINNTTAPSNGTVGGSLGGFCGTVFNTGASQNPGWPNVIWDSLSSHGLSDWSITRFLPLLYNFSNRNLVAFCVAPLHNCSDYNTGALPDAMQAAQVPVIMDPSKITDGIQNLNSGPNALEIYNEPDYSYGNYTPLTSPADAAISMSQILPHVKNNTQLISPAPAFTNSDYLQQFFANCPECDTRINITAAHVYSVDPAGAVKQVTDLHGKFPHKKIWVTEISPASSPDQGCTLDDDGMIGWMQTVLGQLKALDYVEKIFWNTGAYVSLLSGDGMSYC